MSIIQTEHWMRELNRVDMNICLLFNKGCRYKAISEFFTLVSRLGDGAFFYGLILILPLIYGVDAIKVSLHLSITAVLSIAVYKLIKEITGRQRPCNVHEDIYLAADPLDLYSFPSGHTLHAVSFTLVVMNYYPELGLICIPFVVCIALSRIILGLHYPTDVVAGMVIGATLATFSLQF